MNQASNKPLFTQKVQTEEKWYLDKNNYLSREKNENRGDLIDVANNKPLSEIAATKLGISKYLKSHQSGFGTTFHQAYNNQPDIYHQFSVAEDKNNLILNRILDIQKENNAKTLLDVACGTGNLLNKLNQTGQFTKLVGVDASTVFVEFARTNLADNIDLFLSPAESLPFLRGSFDMCATTWGSFSMNAAFSEMERVVKPGGVILRIGTAGLDDLTSLFPKYDEGIVAANREFLDRHGFVTEKSSIQIEFDSLDEAKRVLSFITGCDPNKVTANKLHHDILISWKRVE